MGRREPAGIELLAEPSRREIVARLAVRPHRPSVLARDLGLARSTITYHLRLLERTRLVWVLSYSVDHRSLLYALHPSALRRVVAWLAGTGLRLPVELEHGSGDHARPRPSPRTAVGAAVRHGSVPAELGADGPGIDPAVAARVFDRFFRTGTGRSRDTGGTGLSLSIVASLVHAHGGAVGHEATPGGGATFVVLLPVAR